jgi:2'-5' RNA ligase
MATPPGRAESAVVIPVELPVAVRRLRDRMDATAAMGVPAHVTLLYPFVPPAAIDESVRQRVARAIRAEPAFPFTLTGPHRWPDVVYLTPEPDEPFRRMFVALAEAFPEHPPYGGTIEVQKVVPHVTIANDPRAEYLDAAMHALPGMLPARDVAREVWLITHAPQQPWRTEWRIPLGEAAR